VALRHRIMAGFICVKSIQKGLIAESVRCYQRPSMDGGADEGGVGCGRSLEGWGSVYVRATTAGMVTMTIYRGSRRAFVTRKDEALPINWRRGLFRVWLLLSAAWVMAWIIYLIMYTLREGIRSVGDVLVIPVVLIGPPVALLLFGIAAGWAFRGFRVDESQEAANKRDEARSDL
jgi:hypothetical protein